MLDSVYNKRILELAADIPRLGRLAQPQASATAHSRLCGSTITVDLALAEGKVSDYAQELKACALGQASASILARHILGATPTEAYTRALATDPVAAFGSVVGFTCEVDAEVAAALKELFIEALIAPRFSPQALEVLRARKNLRVLQVPPEGDAPALDFKRVRGGFLAQERFRYNDDETGWQAVSKRAPTPAELQDLRFAWAAVMSVKSNAIVLARNGQAIGIGAGQMSRVDSSMLAVHKARAAGHDPRGAVLASDAFFPFRDGVDEAAQAGVTAIIQPGGSVRDSETIGAADEHGMAMIFTGHRQFRH